MKYADDPTPLWRTAETGSVLERSLSAARGRGPTGDQVRELERSILIAVGAAAPVTIGAAPAKAASPGGVATGGASVARLGAVLLVSATVAGTTVGVYWASGRSATPPSLRASSSFDGSRARVERSAAQSALPASAATTAGAPFRSSAAGATPVATPAGSRAHAAARPASHTAPHAFARADIAAAAAAGSPDDVAELQLLSRARRALAADPALALALADEHQRRFSSGSMEQEREVIAVDALVGLGRLAEARRRGERLAREHAGSPYVPRIQQSLSRGAPPQ
jgi:hypothetical protein